MSRRLRGSRLRRLSLRRRLRMSACPGLRPRGRRMRRGPRVRRCLRPRRGLGRMSGGNRVAGRARPQRVRIRLRRRLHRLPRRDVRRLPLHRTVFLRHVTDSAGRCATLAGGAIAFNTGADTFGVSNVRALAIGKPRRAAGAVAAPAFGSAFVGDTCFTPSYVPPPTTTPAATTAATFAATPPKTIEDSAGTAGRRADGRNPACAVAAEALCAPPSGRSSTAAVRATSDLQRAPLRALALREAWQSEHARR